MNFYRAHFGKKLKAAIKAAGISQRTLAEDERIGVDPSAVSKWVTGEDMPAEDRLPAICEILGVAPDYFDPGAAYYLDAADVLSRFANAKPDTQKLILALLHGDSKKLAGTSPTFQRRAIEFLKAVVSP